MYFFKVSVSERVTGLITGIGYVLSTACTPKEEPFVSRGSGEVSVLAGDQTKAAINTGTLTLTVPGGEQPLIWANGNCDLLAGSLLSQ